MSEEFKSPLLVTGTFTPSGTQDVSIVNSIVLSAAVTNFPSTYSVIQNTSPWVISGSVSISNFPTTQPVSQSGSWTVSLISESIEIGTVDQGLGGVSAWLVTGPLTDIQLRASPIPISGIVTVTPSGTQNVSIVSTITLPVSGPLTDTQLRASAVAISGTVAATQSGTWNINNISGTISLPTGAATETTLAAIKTDTDKLTFASTRLLVDGSGVTQPISGTVTTNQGTSPWVVSGTITTSPNVNIHDGSGNTIASTGTSLNVDVTNTVPVTGTFFQATQPVSGSGNFTVVQPTGTNLHTVLDSGTLTGAIPAGTNVIGHVITDSSSTTVVTGNVTVIQPTGTNLHTTIDNFPTTQPISGSVTATQATGSNLHAVIDSGTIAATQSGTWNITNISGTISLPTGASTSAKQPALGTAGTASTDVITVQGITSMIPLKVDGSGVTQPISGTITANAGTNLNTSALLLDATFTGRINTQGQKAMAASTPVVIASDQSTIPISGTITSTVITGTLNNGTETSVTGTAVQVLAANSSRRKLILQNTGTANVRVGTTGVTTTTGFRLTIGATILFDSQECPTNAIFAIREGSVSSTVLAQEIV